MQVGFPPVHRGGIKRSISAVFQRIADKLSFLLVPCGLICSIPLLILERAEEIQPQLLLGLLSCVVSFITLSVGSDRKAAIEFLYSIRGCVFLGSGLSRRALVGNPRVRASKHQKTG